MSSHFGHVTDCNNNYLPARGHADGGGRNDNDNNRRTNNNHHHHHHQQQQQQLEEQQHHIHPAIVDGIKHLSDPRYLKDRHKLEIDGLGMPAVNCQSLQHLVTFLDNNRNNHQAVTITELQLRNICLSQPSDGGLEVLISFFARRDNTTLTKVEMVFCDFGNQQNVSRLLVDFHSNRTVTEFTLQRIQNFDGSADFVNSIPQLQRLLNLFASINENLTRNRQLLLTRNRLTRNQLRRQQQQQHTTTNNTITEQKDKSRVNDPPPPLQQQLPQQQQQQQGEPDLTDYSHPSTAAAATTTTTSTETSRHFSNNVPRIKKRKKSSTTGQVEKDMVEAIGQDDNKLSTSSNLHRGNRFVSSSSSGTTPGQVTGAGRPLVEPSLALAVSNIDLTNGNNNNNNRTAHQRGGGYGRNVGGGATKTSTETSRHFSNNVPRIKKSSSSGQLEKKIVEAMEQDDNITGESTQETTKINSNNDDDNSNNDDMSREYRPPPPSIREELIEALWERRHYHIGRSLSEILASGDCTDDDKHWILCRMTYDTDFRYNSANGRRLNKKCDMIYNSMSPSLKEMYNAAEIADPGSPLHLAARHGCVETVKILLPYCNVNQKNRQGETPLSYACATTQTSFSIQIPKLLLESGDGADVNLGGGVYGPIYMAVEENNFHLVQYLLEKHQANPNLNRLPAKEESSPRGYRCTDLAMKNDNPKMLELLLDHNALVGGYGSTGRDNNTNVLFYRPPTPPPSPPQIAHMSAGRSWSHSHREFSSHRTKTQIVRILVKHVKKTKDQDTMEFLLHAFKHAIERYEYIDDYKILINGGLHPSSRAFYIAIKAKQVTVIESLIRHGGNPFLLTENEDADEEEDDDDADDDDDEEDASTRDGDGDIEFIDDDDDDEDTDDRDDDVEPLSPFHAAARIKNERKATEILQLFWEHWNELYATSFGRDANGDFPLHLLCRDKHVTIRAIQLFMDRFGAIISQPSNGPSGLLPFHLALESGASLDVIFFLLSHYPDALKPQEHRFAATTNTTTTVAAAAASTTDESLLPFSSQNQHTILHVTTRAPGNLSLEIGSSPQELLQDNHPNVPDVHPNKKHKM